MVERLLLVEQDHRIAVHFPPVPSDTLIITFSRFRRGQGETGFGAGFVRWLGFTHIHVSDGAEKLYQSLTPQALLAATAGLRAGHDRLFLYGSDVGGHAALYYANWTKGRAVAITPRLPAHPYFRPWQDRARGLARQPLLHRDLNEVADADLSPVLLYDPWNAPQAAYVETLVRPAYPEAWFVPIRGAGDRVARILAYQRRLKPILSDIFLHNRPPETAYALGQRPRRDLARAIRALNRGRTEIASRHLFRVMRDPSTPGLAEAMERYAEVTGNRFLM